LSERNSERPWYRSGLRFACVPECGACCTRHDDYAYVYLSSDDVRRLTRHLGLTRDDFLSRFTIVDDGDVVLKMVDPECPFLVDWRCSVYRVRPVQCRTFPFWEENLQTRTSWRRLRDFCPGIGEGALHPAEQIDRLVEERKRGEDSA
jgi:Fe-S-cluster containining protein